jgi:GT2 family glycosyltransferase
MRLAIIVPTYGRAALARRTVARFARQTRRPDILAVSAPDESHVDCSRIDGLEIEYVFGARGAAAQRNRALARVLSRCDVVTFFDDDFLPADDYLELTVAAFERHPDWAVLTGDVLRDGINGAGIAFDEAEALLAWSPPVPLEAGEARDWHAGYGCNMSIRTADIGEACFDERLVLYSWLEDVDFTRRVARAKRIVRHTSLRGVHLGIKSGRVSGVRLGYSQVINPLYLVAKGSYPPRLAAQQIGRNLLSNVGRLAFPEPWIDRRGRLRGNLIAMRHLLRGRLEPERALEI